jgi:energy-coupling factor transporter ATP-binding protein EcfA2
VTGGLAVVRLRLARFRSHRAADLSLDGRPVAITGPNGAGKTNLIEALSLLSPGRGLRGAAAEDLACARDAGGWKLRAEIAGAEGRHEVASWSEGAGRSVEIDGKPAPQAALGAVVRVLWLTPAMDRLWMDAASERRRFLDRLTLSLVPRPRRRGGLLRARAAGAQPPAAGRRARRGLVRGAGGADGRAWGAGGGEPGGGAGAAGAGTAAAGVPNGGADAGAGGAVGGGAGGAGGGASGGPRTGHDGRAQPPGAAPGRPRRGLRGQRGRRRGSARRGSRRRC